MMRVNTGDVLSALDGGFLCRHREPGAEEWEYFDAPNLVTIEGMTLLLASGLQGTTWYVAMIDNTITPPATSWTYATMETIEVTAYAETTRELWDETAIAEALGVVTIDNDAAGVNWAEFNFNATVTVYGLALVSHSAKGDHEQAGAKMYAAAHFAEAKNMVDGSVLQVMYKTGIKNPA